MQRGFVVDGDFFAWFDVAQGDEQNVAVENLHIGVRLTGMIDVVGAVPPAAAIETPSIIYCADA
jgi:hypothetical protein